MSNKKLDWIEKHAGKDAANAMSQFMTDASGFAKEARIEYKEADFLDEVEGGIADEVVTVTEPVTTTKKEAAKPKTVKKSTVLDEDEPVIEQSAEVVSEITVVTEKEVEVTAITEGGDLFLSQKDFEAAIEILIDTAITPLLKQLETQQAEIADLQTNIAQMTKTLIEANKEAVAEVLAVVPAASAASFVQARLANSLKNYSPASVAPVELVKDKPDETPSAVVQNIDLFLSGK